MEGEWRKIMLATMLWIMLSTVAGRIINRGQAQPPLPTDMPTVHETQPSTDPPPTAPLPVLQIPVVTDDGTVLMELEEYIRGVVLAEMPAYFAEEALKAQAVAARTYALRHMSIGGKHTEGAVCTRSSCCQAYLTDTEYLEKRGAVAERDKIARAVEATAGIVVTYKGRLADTTYFASSGGRTEDAAAVWGSEIPYLQSVESPGEEGASSYEHSVYFEKEQFAALLERTLHGDPAQWLGAYTTTAGGGVDTIVIAGITYSGKQVRKLLGLRSTCFTMTADAGGIHVLTRGYGHRVGMSQYGADAMADAGSDFTQILQHYYPGTVIDKIGNIG